MTTGAPASWYRLAMRSESALDRKYAPLGLPTGDCAVRTRPLGGRSAEKLDTCTIGSRPSLWAASITISVPTTLVRRTVSPSRMFNEKAEPQWTTASQPAIAASTVAGSVTSPTV